MIAANTSAKFQNQLPPSRSRKKQRGGIQSIDVDIQNKDIAQKQYLKEKPSMDTLNLLKSGGSRDGKGFKPRRQKLNSLFDTTVNPKVFPKYSHYIQSPINLSLNQSR